MVKLIIKSLFLSIFVLIIFFLTLYVCMGVGELLEHSLAMLFVYPLALMISCWIFTFLLDKIAFSMDFMYWLVCFLFCLAVLILGLMGRYGLSIDEYSGVSFTKVPQSSADSSFLSMFFNNPAIAWHSAVLMLLIPKLDGEWDTYLNTEVTVYSNGNVHATHWISKEYTSGTSIKVGIILFIAVIAGVLYYVNPLCAWIPFFVEGGFSAWLFFINLKKYRYIFDRS